MGRRGRGVLPDRHGTRISSRDLGLVLVFETVNHPQQCLWLLLPCYREVQLPSVPQASGIWATHVS